MPNQAALAAGYDAGKNAEENVVQITGALVAARTHLQTQRALVVNQIRALVRELRYNLAEQPLPRQREIMRTYGVRFQADEGEAAEIPVPDSGQEAELALA